MRPDQRKKRTILLLAMLGSFLFLSCNACASEKVISPEEAAWIGQLIFQNECAGKDSALLTWNEGENFPSLGIGHFIWYPENYRGPFKESFPQLIQSLEKKGVLLPDWFKTLPGIHAPWATKADFLKAIQSGELDFLREFLIETKKEQSIFLIERFSESISKMLEAVPQNSRRAIYQKLSVVLKADNGLYPLVDYVNFNGEGILESERYKGEGWGLLQVLEEMNLPAEDAEVVSEFVKAVERVLDRRVSNSPPERNEIRWLPGWRIRARTYLAPQVSSMSVDNRLLRGTLLSVLADDVNLGEAVTPPIDDMIPPPSIAR